MDPADQAAAQQLKKDTPQKHGQAKLVSHPLTVQLHHSTNYKKPRNCKGTSSDQIGFALFS